jgi:putative salt-induced outer membrane protein
MILNRKASSVIAATTMLLPLIASAHWSGKGEAGAALSSANSGATNTTFTAKLDVADEIDKWKHAFGGSTIYTSSRAEATVDDTNPQNETAAKRWELHEQSNYSFLPTTFWFAGARYERDDLGSFEYQAVLSTGVGHTFFDSEQGKLVGQVGVGYKRFKNRDADTDGEAIVTGSLEYRQQLTSNTMLLDKLAVEAGSNNTLLQNDLSLQVKMTDVLALGLGYQLRYNTKPGVRVAPSFPIGDAYAHSDRLLTANLVYEFK